MVTHVIIDELRRKGVAYSPPLHPETVAEVNRYFECAPVYDDAHVAQTARKDGREAICRSDAVGNCYCVDGHVALVAPHLLEAALWAYPIAEAYLRAPPWLYSVNAFWTRPGGSVRPDIQAFHRDLDDSSFLAMFVYLDDVTSEHGGPHQLRGPDGKLATILGRAGTVFFADTSHEHRGLRPTHGERGIYWARWSVNPRPAAFVWDGTTPVPAVALGRRYPRSPELQRALSPLVTPP